MARDDAPPPLAPAIARILQFPGGAARRQARRSPSLEPSGESAHARSLGRLLERRSGPSSPMCATRSSRPPARAAPVRVYDPESSGDRPVFFFHGGGWVVGDLDTHDGIARRICALFRPSGDQRRLPPRAGERPTRRRSTIAWRWLRRSPSGTADIGIDARRFALSGDSAGATWLSRPRFACATRGCRRQARRRSSMATTTRRCAALPTRGSVMATILLDSGRYALVPGTVPRRRRRPTADLRRADRCRSVGAAAALHRRSRVRSAARRQPRPCRGGRRRHDVPHELRIWKGMIHGFAGMGRRLNQADHFLAELAVWLGRTLAISSHAETGWS